VSSILKIKRKRKIPLIRSREFIETLINSKFGKLKFRIYEDKIYLSCIELKKKYQRKGIGSSILNALKEVSLSLDKPIYLWSLPSARTFYLKHGFLEIYTPKIFFDWIPMRWSKENAND